MGDWVPSVTTGLGGRFQLVLHKLTKGGAVVDVTRVRSATTQFESYSASDPFGDSTAVFTFPAITPFDDLDAPDLSPWLANYANVDLYWIPAILPVDDRYMGRSAPVFSALSGQAELVTPSYLRDADGNRTTLNRKKVWEGFIASMDFTASATDSSLQIQCQGALFQLDHYLQKPFFPARPWPLEALVAEVFSHARKPHLRTHPLIVQWPAGWTKVVPPYPLQSANVYAPAAKPGTKWTGLTSRNTGSWEHALTGFVQDQLSLLIVDNSSGVTPGNQWTVLQRRSTAASPSGRQPVMSVRDRFRPPDFSVWVGAHGVDVTLSADSTQSENIVFGDGTDVNGAVWRNAVIADDGSRTDYLPLAASSLVYPAKHNTAYTKAAFASEAFVKFGAGMAQRDAAGIAKQQLQRDQLPGWSGSITLSVDPNAGLSRWRIQAGQTVLLKGFLGTGESGVPFHIASTQASPMQGTMALTVDSRYRDLLTVAEAQARTRDPLDPIRMLQVNKTSVLIEDIQAPWDYNAGSGFIPKASKDSYSHKPEIVRFPYASWVKAHPPLHYPNWYKKCNASSSSSKARWAGPVPILTSEKGTIARSEFFACDVYGNIVKVPFHVSIYSINVTVADMPFQNHVYSPYLDGAFESINPATGQPWDSGNFLQPDPSMLIGWGNRTNGIYNRAGFSPGSEAEGGHPTGLLFDDTTWTFDNTAVPGGDYNVLAKPGVKQTASSISLYAMFYCEHAQPVFFQGRLYRQNPGQG